MAEDKEKQNFAQKSSPLAEEAIPSLIRKFAIPSVIAMLVSSIYNITDQIFIGNGVGYLGNAATNIVYPLNIIILTVQLLVGTGSSILFNISMGKGDRSTASKIFGNCLYFLLAFGTAFALFISLFYAQALDVLGVTDEIYPYAAVYLRITAIGMPFMLTANSMSYLIRSDGNPRYSMNSTLIGAIANVVLDAIFVFICKWGIAGAAAATVIGQILSFVYSMRYIKMLKSIEFSFKGFKMDFALFFDACKHGLAGGVNQFSNFIIQLSMNRLLRYYGGLSVYGSDIPIACVGIVQKVYMIFFSIVIGISQGAQPIYGYNTGAKNYVRVRKTYYEVLKLCFFVCGAALVVFEVFPSTVFGMFGSGEEMYMVFGVTHMRIAMSMFMFMCAANVTTNFFSGIGKAYLGMFLALMWRIGTMLPLMFIFTKKIGVFGVSVAMASSDAIIFILAGILVFIELKKQYAEERLTVDR